MQAILDWLESGDHRGRPFPATADVLSRLHAEPDRQTLLTELATVALTGPADRAAVAMRLIEHCLLPTFHFRVLHRKDDPVDVLLTARHQFKPSHSPRSAEIRLARRAVKLAHPRRRVEQVTEMAPPRELAQAAADTIRWIVLHSLPVGQVKPILALTLVVDRAVNPVTLEWAAHLFDLLILRPLVSEVPGRKWLEGASGVDLADAISSEMWRKLGKLDSLNGDQFRRVAANTARDMQRRMSAAASPKRGKSARRTIDAGDGPLELLLQSISTVEETGQVTVEVASDLLPMLLNRLRGDHPEDDRLVITLATAEASGAGNVCLEIRLREGLQPLRAAAGMPALPSQDIDWLETLSPVDGMLVCLESGLYPRLPANLVKQWRRRLKLSPNDTAFAAALSASIAAKRAFVARHSGFTPQQLAKKWQKLKPTLRKRFKALFQSVDDRSTGAID